MPQNHLADEFFETLRLAVPMALTQLGQIAMMTIDLVLIGRLGEDAVAAAALANTVYFVSFTVGMGVVSAVAPLAAQAYGAGDARRVRRALRVGLWAALVISLPMMAFRSTANGFCWRLDRRGAGALAQRYLFGLGGARASAVAARDSRLHGRGEPSASRCCGSRSPRSPPTRCWSMS